MSLRTGGRRPSLLVLAVGASLVTAACGGSQSGAEHDMGSMPSMSSATSTPGSSTAAGTPAVQPGPPAQGPQNDADIAFAMGMIPHHGQAVQMADMVLAAGSNAEVKKLATAIKQAQSPEINTLAGWLQGWGSEVPDPYGDMSDMGHDMSGMDDGGMMSDAEMRDLGAAKGVAADRMFLQMMPVHHEGAIAMARQELAKGSNPQAKQLAQAIIDSQSAEIETMRKLLASLS